MNNILRHPWIKRNYQRFWKAVLPHSVTYNSNRNDRIGALHRAWGYAYSNFIEGAYYEFGVYKGESFRNAVKVHKGFDFLLQSQLVSSEKWRNQMALQYAQFRHHFYAFDTFQGIPENNESNPAFAKGSFFCSLEEFENLNREWGITQGDHVRYFKGRFSEIAINKAAELRDLQPAAIVNVDGDLYISAIETFEIILPKLLQGSVLLFDDWNHYSAKNTQGERRAVLEILGSHPEITLEPWFSYEFVGQAFLVHKNPPAAKIT